MNLDTYTTEMSKSIWDKSFFMDKIVGAKIVLDFGCADGAMIRLLAPLFPSITFIGYDIKSELIRRANFAIDDFGFTSNMAFYNAEEFNTMIADIKNKFSSDEICINFSSVLHEIFSSHMEGRATIKKLVDELKPRYITIRDMYFAIREDRSNYYLSTHTLNNILDNLKIDRNYSKEFEQVFGDLTTPYNLIHFLMKYQWKDNGWADEMEEDYFSWNFPAIDHTLWNYDDYNIIFRANYMLPYLYQCWKNSGLDCEAYTTHGQFILERK